MPTDPGRAYVIYRLTCCDDLDALKTVWHSLSPAYQRDPKIQKVKDTLKATMLAEQNDTVTE